jgi:hypothetical protein
MPEESEYEYEYEYDTESKNYSEFSVTSVGDTSDIYSIRPPASQLSKPVSLSWKNLTYKITDPKTKKEKKIVHNVSGLINPGELLASK